jgi:hypothetical protein
MKMFAAPSPKGTNFQGLHLNSAGELFDRSGRRWGRSQIVRMALDAALPEAGRTQRSTAEWAQSHARTALYKTLDEACREHELSDDQSKELRELIDKHLSGEAHNEGAGAIDRDRGKGAIDDETELDDKIREYLSGHGLAAADVERAIEIARRDREAARDSRPQPATRGGFGGRFSGATKDDVESEYGGGHLLDLPDYKPDPNRGLPGYDPNVYRASERAVSKMAGGGTGRRLNTPAHTPTGDAALAFDAELTELIENVKVGVWG